MEKLVFERTLPIQGEPVNVYIRGSRGKSGQLILTYEEWLHFNKLLREGIDSLKRKNETRIEIVIKGVEGKTLPIAKEVMQKTKITPIPKELLDEAVKDILNPLADEEIDLEEEDKKEIAKAEKEQGLVRSLLPEVENDTVD